MSVDNILEQLESIDQKLHQSSLNLDSIELQLQQQQTHNTNPIVSNDVSNASIEWPAARIRSTFIDFFVHKKNHVMWPSSPVVPVNDPTLLFANAGTVQQSWWWVWWVMSGDCNVSLSMASMGPSI